MYKRQPFAEFVDPHPAAGNAFGTHVVVLNTGNVVITAPFDDAGGTNAGAVYLFNGTTGALISTLTGSSANDNVGSGGVKALSGGDFVATSSAWDNGAAADAGAVTWGSGTTGVSGPVSAANSLVGTTTNENVGRVTVLSGGNYVVSTDRWNNGAVQNAGAVTWANGSTGLVGVITALNSVVGTSSNDGVGSVTALTNGNYVVWTSSWDFGASENRGAARWCSGSGTSTGGMSAANSLVGAASEEKAGNSVVALTNGNYLVFTPDGAGGTGALTWGNGVTGTVGVVSVANSLVGSTMSDKIGADITVLTNGNYVTRTSSWDNGAIVNAGAVTWGNGATGTVGTVSAANSIVGSAASDMVGNTAVVALTNGNYLVGSPSWRNGGVARAGALTWGNGSVGTSGVISAANSLVGSTASDGVGQYSIALTNGNYVTGAADWDNPGLTVDAGAVTWGNGATGTVGVVSAANSLIGSTQSDRVGEENRSLSALANGHYVVTSGSWRNGSASDAGAVTWGNGTTGITGPITALNSLVGSSANDNLGAQGVKPLMNGNYVVSSGRWSSNGTSVGAATWGNGLGGTVGPVSAANSIVGGSSTSYVAYGGSVSLSDGNYVVVSAGLQNGAFTAAGAATWGNGATGTVGVVSSANSLVGEASATGLRSAIVVDRVNGSYYAVFLTEGGGKVRVGAAADGIAPTLRAPNHFNVTPTSAELFGSVESDNGRAVTARGFLHSVTSTNADPRIGGPGVVQTALTGTTGDMTTALAGLTTGSEVSYRAYATNSAGTSYTIVRTFTPVATPPSMNSIAASGIGQTGFTLGGNVTSDGGSPVTERGVVYSLTALNPSPFIGAADVTKVVAGGTTGTFSANITGLTAGTAYSSKAFARNAIGSTYGVRYDFTTLDPNLSISDASVVEGNSGTQTLAFTVTLSAPSSKTITVSYASSNGTATAGSDYTSTSGALTINAGQTSGVITVPISGDATFESDETLSVALTDPTNAGLIRATAVGTITNDDPAPTAPVIADPASSGVTATTATLGGNVTSDGTSAVTERGVVYALSATNGNPLLDGAGVTKSTVLGTTGVFSSSVAGLVRASGYSFKAFARNAIGTSYTAATTFTTPASVSEAPTIGTATASNGAAAVLFAAPSNDGGSTITGYTATCGTKTATATSSPITVAGMTNGVAIRCTVFATNAVGNSAPSSASNSVTPGFTGTAIPRLVNISTRGLVATGDNIMIGGFIVGGSEAKKVLIRGRGPSMAALGVPGTLADPAIRLFSGATPIDFNDNWQSATNAAEITASGQAPTDTKEAAVLTTVNPGVPYTVHLTGVAESSGIAIVEVFELDKPEIPLLNISTRGPVLSGDHVMIGGFIIQGADSQQVLIIAKGPSLGPSPFNVAGALADPRLELYQAGVTSPIETNDNWVDSVNAAAIQASGNVPTSPLESAIIRTLAPGAYTAIVKGAGAFQGVGLVEVYKK